MSSTPLTVRSFAKTVTVAINGNTETIKGMAFAAPFVKLSYTFTFLVAANTNEARNKTGIINAKILFNADIPPLFFFFEGGLADKQPNEGAGEKGGEGSGE